MRGDDDVLAPEKDVARFEQVEEVVRIFLAEVEQLCCVAAARADVAALRRHRTELGEEVVGEVFERAQRPSTAVVEDGLRTRPGADPGQLAGGKAARLVPR